MILFGGLWCLEDLKRLLWITCMVILICGCFVVKMLNFLFSLEFYMEVLFHVIHFPLLVDKHHE